MDYGRRPRNGPATRPSQSPARYPSSHPGPRYDRHPRTHWNIGRPVVDDDLDRDTLHHLHEIAGGVFRGQQAERGARAGLHRLHMAVELAARVGIDPDLDRLAGT